MIARLKNLVIRSFKGIADKQISFEGDTTVFGANGTGKTTVADAYMWTLTGKDSKIKDNPIVNPIGVTEANPDVTVELDIDGKEVTVRKVQTYKVKDGKESTSNQYYVNDVPMTERDYKARLEEYGVDAEMFLPLTHPDYLLNDTSKKGRDYMRNLLFSLAEDKSDAEIAEAAGLTELVAEFEKGYKVAEIEAKNKATLSKIDKEIGKDNKVANARIDELSKRKSGANASVINGELTEIEAKIKEAMAEREASKTALDKVQVDLMQIDFDLNGLGAELNDKYRNELFELERIEHKNKEALDTSKRAESDYGNRIIKLADDIKELEAKLNNADGAKAKFESETVDVTESMTICPTCGQKYPVGMIDGIRHNLERKREKELEELAVEVVNIKAMIEERAQAAEELNSKLKAERVQIETLEAEEKRIQGLKGRLVKPDVANSTEYKELIEKKNYHIKVKSDLAEELAVMDAKLRELNEAKHNKGKELILVDQDKEIDARIAEIRNEIRSAEINRANAEKMIDMLAQLNKAKNEALEESVNSRFRLVKWKLFKTLKNGNYEDACTPLIDGYELGTSTNKAREILAKLDIVAGLQKAFDKHYPVFLDNAEALSGATKARIDIDTQLIAFAVTEDAELRIEGSVRNES